jgi:thiol-disulfide isomerase/thioredoxin
MKPVYLMINVLIFLFLCTASCTDETKDTNVNYSTPSAIADGKELPKFRIIVRSSEQERQYLGLKDDIEIFSISEVSAKIIIIEIFTINCPSCRLQAPILNNVYKFVDYNDELSSDIKMIGIAVGCDYAELEKWKSSMSIPFPLFLDENYIVWQQLGKPGIPCTLIINGNGKVLTSHFGVTKDEEDLFRQIKKLHKQQ